MRKSWIAIGMSVLMTAVMLTGCGGSSASDTSASDSSKETAPVAENADAEQANAAGGTAYKIAVVPKMTNIGWFQRMEEGVKKLQ